jgi:malate/lactate dehydrogenase
LIAVHHGAGAAASSATSSVQHGATAIVDLAGAGTNLGWGFAMAYATAALIAAIAFVVTLWMPTTPASGFYLGIAPLLLESELRLTKRE